MIHVFLPAQRLVEVVPEVGTVRQVHGHLYAGSSLAAGLGQPHAVQAGLIPQRLCQALADGDAHVFRRVVVIDPQISVALDLEGHAGFPGEDGIEFVEKGCSRFDLCVPAGSVQQQVHRYGGFFCGSLDFSFSFQCHTGQVVGALLVPYAGWIQVHPKGSRKGLEGAFHDVMGIVAANFFQGDRDARGFRQGFPKGFNGNRF
mmetsp:Transcript_23979/g.50984  ORF Transcript_23979/g.50984 Transcript_23979/m.50984 type:complete len:202 (+) Transcript_23979:352-957(+)